MGIVFSCGAAMSEAISSAIDWKLGVISFPLRAPDLGGREVSKTMALLRSENGEFATGLCARVAAEK
jgi:hypothetical protein